MVYSVGNKCNEVFILRKSRPFSTIVSKGKFFAYLLTCPEDLSARWRPKRIICKISGGPKGNISRRISAQLQSPHSPKPSVFERPNRHEQAVSQGNLSPPAFLSLLPPISTHRRPIRLESAFSTYRCANIPLPFFLFSWDFARGTSEIDLAPLS
jgi:hypothetical protein